MQNHPFQATVVGQATVPKRKRGIRKSQYSFLDNMRGQLENGQAIRLVIPEGKSSVTPLSHWYRICGKGKGHFMKQKQENGTYILWLWCDNK